MKDIAANAGEVQAKQAGLLPMGPWPLSGHCWPDTWPLAMATEVPPVTGEHPCGPSWLMPLPLAVTALLTGPAIPPNTAIHDGHASAWTFVQGTQGCDKPGLAPPLFWCRLPG